MCQNLIFDNQVSLIDIKNAVFQAIRPHIILSAGCTSHITMATEVKQIVDIVREQEKFFLILVKTLLKLEISFSSVKIPIIVITLTSEIRVRFGNTADAHICCFLL